jgi:hypothetical protein
MSVLGVSNVSSEEELRQKARFRAQAKISFYIHLGVYSGVNLMLILIWWFTGGLNEFPWFIFPLVFWGIGLLAHYLAVFTRSSYVDRMTEQEYRKLKEEQQT